MKTRQDYATAAVSPSETAARSSRRPVINWICGTEAWAFRNIARRKQSMLRGEHVENAADGDVVFAFSPTQLRRIPKAVRPRTIVHLDGFRPFERPR